MAGALVISLDFELHWGFSDHRSLDANLKGELLEARRAVEKLLNLFRERDIHATWATVGFLLLEKRDQLQQLAPPPHARPQYAALTADPYTVEVGDDERSDPFHFAPSLVKKIVAAENQELASHTFSHYYCLEPGQSAQHFESDLQSMEAAAQLHSARLKSIVFPRNQYNPHYSQTLLKYGIEAYRGNPAHPFYRAADRSNDRAVLKRIGRLCDTYVNLSGHHLLQWQELYSGTRPLNIRASRFLRPASSKLSVLEPFKIARIKAGIRAAARSNSIFHLWWHPHNFARRQTQNFRNLELILAEFDNCRERYGMRSLNIGEFIDMVRPHNKEN